MLYQVRNVETVARHHVALAERIVVARQQRIEPLVDVDVNLPVDVIQARIALAVSPHVNRSFDMEQTVHAMKFQMDTRRLREFDPFKRLQGHLVVEQHALPASGEEAPNIDFVRTAHGKNATCSMKAPPPVEPHYNLAILGPPSTPCQTPGSEGERGAMNIDATTSQLAAHGVAFAPAIAGAAKRQNVDPTLLAAVAAQETGGPGSNAGRNVVGDGGHGHGLFQIDDRWHDFAKEPAAMDPAANADYAAGMLHGLIAKFGGNVHEALSAYNSGSPNAAGTTTTWGDGQTLGYADSVMKHYQQLGGSSGGLGTAVPSQAGEAEDPTSLEESVIAELSTLMASIGSLASQAQSMPGMPSLSQPSQQPQSYHRATTDYSGLLGDDDAT